MTDPSSSSRKPVAGANLPWGNYGFDFGSSPDIGVHEGVSTAWGHQNLERKFEQLEIHNVPVVRWFLFCDGRSGIVFDPQSGLPTGLAPGTIRDIGAALDMAARHKVQIHFALFDYIFGTDSVKVPTNDPAHPLQQGGHGDVLHSAAGREALLNKVIVPALEAIGNHSSVFAIEFMNEPEQLFDIDLKTMGGSDRITPVSIPVDGVNVKEGQQVTATQHPFVGKADVASFVDFAGVVAGKVHELTGKPFTIGSAKPEYMSLWRSALTPGAGDFAQFHSYQPAESFQGLSEAQKNAIVAMSGFVPVILGEFPFAPPQPRDGLEKRLEGWLNAGLSGAFGWRSFGEDDKTRALDFAAWDRFFEANKNRLSRLDQKLHVDVRKFLDRLGLGGPELKLSGPTDWFGSSSGFNDASKRPGFWHPNDSSSIRNATQKIFDDTKRRRDEQQRLDDSLRAIRKAAEEQRIRSRPSIVSSIGIPGVPPRSSTSTRMPDWTRGGSSSSNQFGGPVHPTAPRSRNVWVNDRYVFRDLDRKWDGSLIPGPDFRGTEIRRIRGHWETRRY